MEILIALAVMLVGVVGIMSLFPVGLRASKVGENYMLASILAQYTLDEARLTSYASLSDSLTRTAFSSPDDKFSWTRAINNPTPPVANLKTITVDIYWSDLGTDRYEEFITYRANY